MSHRPAPLRIGIAGAGVLGRLAAWRLERAGHAVTVFDPAPGPQARHDGRGAAGFTAAGMLSPLAERDGASPAVAAYGWRSLPLWADIAQALAQDDTACTAARAACASAAALGRPAGDTPAGFGADPWPRATDRRTPALLRREGSLLLAHGSDLGAAERVLARLHDPAMSEAPRPIALDRAALQALEPALDPQLRAWQLPGEGQLLPAPVLAALAAAAPDVDWRWGRAVARVEPGALVEADGRRHGFDWAFDLRGLGARPADAAPGSRPGSGPGSDDEPAGDFTRRLRGVRGELVWLHAPGVVLQRPLRLLHPRHRVYIVPRPDERIVIGASEIESEDRSPPSLRSAVELMAAAHSVIPALAEARIVHLESNLRPALPDHEPRIHAEPGRLRINGLFRHGWLIAPALLADGLAACGLAQAPDPLPAEAASG